MPARTGTLVVNANTAFLVRSGAGTTASPYTFKSITGFTNIDNYANAAEVDWVDLNGDNVADYVYVIARYHDLQGHEPVLLRRSAGRLHPRPTVRGSSRAMSTALPAKSSSLTMTALQSTLTVNGQIAAEPETNTLYVVALEDGVVKQRSRSSLTGEQLQGAEGSLSTAC